MVFGRIADAAGCNDGSLSRDQSRYGRKGSDRTGICQADCCILKIRRDKVSITNAVQDLVVLFQELTEIEYSNIFDIRNKQ